MNTTESNKLIAEFMGAILGNGTEKYPTVYINVPNWYGKEDTWAAEMLQYHKRWDWLMPVVKKISLIGGSFEYETPQRDKFEDIFYLDGTFSNFMEADISAIYERCVEFIKWYYIQQITWEDVEKYYPDYYRADEILESDILSRYANKEQVCKADLKWIKSLGDWKAYRKDLDQTIYLKTAHEKFNNKS